MKHEKDQDEVINYEWVDAYLDSKCNDLENEVGSGGDFLRKLQRGVLYRDWDHGKR